MSELNWGLLDPNAYQRGMVTGKSAFDGVAAVIKQRSLQRALTDFQADPNNSQARAYLYSTNPALAETVETTQLKRAQATREGDARSALSDWMLGQGANGATPNALSGLRPMGISQASMPAQMPSGPVNALSGAPPSSPLTVAPRSSLQEPPTAGDPNWERYVHADPAGAMKTLLSRHEVTKAQNEALFTQMDLMARLARSAVDQPSYDAALQQARAAGLDTSSMPTEFDPARVNSIELQALSAKEHLSQQREDRKLDWNIEDDQIDNSRADRNVDSQVGYRQGQLANTRRGQNLTDARGRRGQDLQHGDRTRGQDLTDARGRGSASYQGRGGRGGGAAPAVAVGPDGHKIVVKNGRWVDAQTGQPVQ